MSHRISVHVAEEVTLASLKSIFTGTAKKYNVVQRDTTTEKVERKNIEKAIEKTEVKLKRAKQAYLDGIDSAEEYKENKANILDEKGRLTLELSNYNIVKIDDKLFKEQIKNLYQLLQSDASIEEKSTAAQQMIQKIVYVKNEERLEFYYYV